mgnify:CR=1 FL=1
MEYPNSGLLCTSTQKNNERSPDMFGDITVDKDYLMSLMEEAQGSPSVKIKLSGWRRKDKNGLPMVSIKVNTMGKSAAPIKTDAKDPWDD